MNSPKPGFPSVPAAAVLLLSVACGAPTSSEHDPFVPGVEKQALSADNGLSLNGLNMNGLNMNGLNMNGLNMNGLASAAFQSWFNLDPSTTASVMRYVYGCAAPSGSTLSWTNPPTRQAYTWSGVFGLAPGWVAGNPATEAEQQLVTGCLAAHVNKYGLHVLISVEGRSATGAQIPIAPDELTTYSVREGCFFGNLFTGEGVFAGPDHSSWDAKTSSARACVFAFKYKGSSNQCPPILQLGDCKSTCTPDATKTFYETCTYNKKTYRAITTRIPPSEVFKCGDGVCQSTESCGTGSDWDNCKLDCGLCP